MPIRSTASAMLISALALTLSSAAWAEGGSDDITEHGVTSTDVNHVATQIGGTATRVARTSDDNYAITLSNGVVVLVKTRGNTRVHSRSSGVNSTSVDDDGHLRLLTADGHEMTVESAQHSETETRTLLAQNGMSSVTTSGGRVTATRRDGSSLSLEADYEVHRNNSTGVARYTETSTGADIDYTDGTHQHFHGAAADDSQLRTSALSLGYTVTFNSDGSANARANGATVRVRLSPTLTTGASTRPGLRIENGRVVMQYQNGQEQEVIVQ